jgi:hypothetical protein
MPKPSAVVREGGNEVGEQADYIKRLEKKLKKKKK